METEKNRIDRFYKLYKKGRRANAPQSFIDYFEASHFLLKEIDKALSQQREEIAKMIKGMKLVFCENVNAWCREKNGVIYTNNDEIAKVENQALQNLLTNLTKEQ